MVASRVHLPSSLQGMNSAEITMKIKLSNLSKTDKKIARIRYIEFASLMEIAAATKYSRNAVAYRLYKVIDPAL